MSKITTIIVDDEPTNIELLKIYLNRYCPTIDIIGTYNNLEEAVIAINDLKPRLIFLDIVLDTGTGFDLLKRINYEGFSVVFVTAFQEYAIQAIKCNAIDFILKPVNPQDLIGAVFKIQNEINSHVVSSVANGVTTKTKTSDYNFIAIPSTKKIDFVKIDDILYFESDGRYTIVHLTDKSTLVVSKNIGEYDKTLAPKFFYRIHKRFLINIKYIVNINNADGSNCELKGNIMLPVAKRRKEQMVSYLNIRG